MNDYKILLVEDAPHWRKILKIYINTALDHLGSRAEIFEAESLERAWDRLENDKWDLLCTDIGLSETAGASEGNLLVSRASEKNIPTIVISGTPTVTSKQVRDFFMKYKVADFFPKQTFNSTEFVQLVELLLYSSEPNIIIFYNSANSKEANELKSTLFSRLSSNNLRLYYYNEKHKNNHMWNETIPQLLKSTVAVILVLSADFLASHVDESSLPKFINNIISSGKKVISVVISPCDVHSAEQIFSLSNVNIIDCLEIGDEISDQEALLDSVTKKIGAILNEDQIIFH